ncbi:MAG: protein translocase subunit SecF [Spirochaetaceae bacterium]|jgi:preprotein translocase subunit SecF|nr:protein translocase subunit SecF [Spirochaetaceae bacterium]
MKRIIPFSKYFLPAAVFSSALIAAGIAGYAIHGGFNLGIDFQAGLIQEIRLASDSGGTEDIRATLSSLGTVSVQNIGDPEERRFMIRVSEAESDGRSEEVLGSGIQEALQARFGADNVTVTQSDYVGSRFSKQLTDQAGILMGLTVLLILTYASIRFRPRFAVGAVLAIAHDALIIVGFVAWSRMEFNTTTIAAILTILGYSINDTIVVFDRIRETRRLAPEEPLVYILDRSVSETLGRTIITTATTMAAVLSLFIFTTGSMRDFALALLVGMISGVYSTIFVAVGFVNFWDTLKAKKAVKPARPALQTK